MLFYLHFSKVISIFAKIFRGLSLNHLLYEQQIETNNMKKNLLAFVLILLPLIANADVVIREENFPDVNFRSYLLGQDYGMDGIITDSEIENITRIDVSSLGISSLKGIEMFYNLLDLFCSKNLLTALDVSKNTRLTELACSDNKLTTLDVSKNMLLEILLCENNQLTTLNLSRNKALYYLRCFKNRIGLDGMSELVGTLPTISNEIDASLIVAYYKNETNVCSKKQVEIAKNKGWKVYEQKNEYGETHPYYGCITIDESYFPDGNFREFLTEQPYGADGALTDNEIKNVTRLDFSGRGIRSVKGIEYFKELTFVNCTNNQIIGTDAGNLMLSLPNLNNNIGRLVFVSTGPNSTDRNMCTRSQIDRANSWIVLENTEQEGWKEFSGCDYYTTNCSYSWESPSGTVEEMGGYASYKCGPEGADRVNYQNNGYWTLSLNGKKTSMGKETSEAGGYIQIDLDQPLDICDVINITGYIYKPEESRIANIFVNFEKGDGVDDSYYFADNDNLAKGGTMITHTLAVPSSAYGSRYIQLTRATTQTNIFITKLTITRREPKPDIAISEDNFPDTSFRKYLKEQSYGLDGKISHEEICTIQTIDVHGKGISNLKGIEHFVALTSLGCYNNQLTELDLSNNTILQNLYCFSNSIETLDISNNTALIDLRCGDNQLSSLDLSNNVDLKYLNCESNELTSIDVSKNLSLETLYCDINYLTHLDVSNNKALIDLACYGNQIKDTEMDILVNSLPIQSYAEFNVYYPDEEEGNVCTKAQVSIAKQKGWLVLYWNNGKWEEYGGYEPSIIINEANFPDANFRTYLLNQSYGADGKITESEISNIESIDVHEQGIMSLKGVEFFTALQYLFCYKNQIKSLDVSKNSALKELWCYNNQLKSLDVSNNLALQKLVCPVNKLTELDVSMLTLLQQFQCQTNKITKLDVSNNTALNMLNCGSNNLTSLDISKNTVLETLYCNSNQLTTIDISQNALLSKLYCYNNLFTNLDVSNNPNLTVIECSNNYLTSLDVSKNTNLTFLSCYCNSICGNNMDNLVNSLPVQENAQFWVYNSDDENENNVCTTIQVQQANAKGWIVAYIKNGGGYIYDGSDPAAVEGTNVDKNEIAEVYTFDGKRIDSMQKGLNLIKMKDGTTRKIIVR